MESMEKKTFCVRIENGQREQLQQRAESFGYRDTAKALRTAIWAINTLSDDELRDLLKRGADAQHKAGVV